MNVKRILESKNLGLYKRLLEILGEYNLQIPCTGVSALFNAAVESGAKILPNDDLALTILKYVLYPASGDEKPEFAGGDVPTAVHRLLNVRFADLPTDCRPISKVGRKHEVAAWVRGGVVYDRVKELIDWDGKGHGNWSNVDGEKVEIIKITEEEK